MFSFKRIALLSTLLAGIFFILTSPITAQEEPIQSFTEETLEAIVTKIVEEVARTLIGSIGLVLAVPISTYLASYIVSRKNKELI